eukprot:1167005-Pleurochrysis_carterae.AAC.9
MLMCAASASAHVLQIVQRERTVSACAAEALCVPVGRGDGERTRRRRLQRQPELTLGNINEAEVAVGA